MSWIGLYPEQREAVEKMKNGCILKGGVGSGKSITSLAYYYKLNGGNIDAKRYSPMNDPPLNLFIITTAKKRDDAEWENELVRYHLSTDRKLSNYNHIVIIDSWNNIKKYKSTHKAFFIFDEDRVTGKGAWVDAFLKIAKNNQWVLLSATPGDGWTDYIPVFIANGFYRNRTDFNNQHVIFDPYITKYPAIKGYYNEEILRRYRASIEVDIDIARTTDRHNIYIEAPYDRDLYKYVTINRWNPYLDKPVEQIAELCSLWRRISNNVPERLEILKEKLTAGTVPKVIIFYNFNYELDELRTLDGWNGYTVAEWNGHKHQPIPDTDKWIYLVNYMSGAEGWNCIETNVVIFFSQTYSHKQLEQAKGRIDRLNTPFKNLYYYHFVSKSPIDRAIRITLRKKGEFSEMKYAKEVILSKCRSKIY